MSVLVSHKLISSWLKRALSKKKKKILVFLWYMGQALIFKQLVFSLSHNRVHLTDWLAGRGQTSMPGGRYLLFPAGSSLSLELGLSLPIEAASGSS